MRQYTLNGTTYHVANDTLFVPLDETHSIEEIDDHHTHFFGANGHDEHLVRLEWGGPIHSSVCVHPVDDDGPPKYYVDADEFEGATPAEAIVPDNVNECPDCGLFAGSVDDDIWCMNCGYREEE